MIELDFVPGLSSVRVLGYKGVRERGGDRRASSSLAIVHAMLFVANTGHPDVGLSRVRYSCRSRRETMTVMLCRCPSFCG